MMEIGSKMECVLLNKQNKPTGLYRRVEVREVRSGSVRVKYRGKGGRDAWIWVQAQMLREVE